MLTTTKPLLSLSAHDLMSSDVVMIPEDMSLQAAARLLSRAGIGGAPVVNANGRCVGVLSASDFLHFAEHDERKHLHRDEACMCSAWQLPEDAERDVCAVREFMTSDPVVVTPGTSIGEVARIMLDAHIHRVIVVVDPERRPIGVVSSTDILAAVYHAARHEPVAPH